MTMKKQEKVLLYRFTDADRLASVKQVMADLKIEVKELKNDDWQEKVGYLLGLPGFGPNQPATEEFSFPHEVMVMQDIRDKRLDKVLKALRETGVPDIAYKSVVTPVNKFWTLKRLCETMQREHAWMIAQEKGKKV